MVVVNIHLLTDRELANLTPKGYVVNVKDIQLTKVIVQMAPKNDSDKYVTYHTNTDTFAKSHENCTEAYLEYYVNDTNNHIELTAVIPPNAELFPTLTTILGKMRHRTNNLARSMESNLRRSGDSYRSQPSNIERQNKPVVEETKETAEDQEEVDQVATETQETEEQAPATAENNETI